MLVEREIVKGEQLLGFEPRDHGLGSWWLPVGCSSVTRALAAQARYSEFK